MTRPHKFYGQRQWNSVLPFHLLLLQSTAATHWGVHGSTMLTTTHTEYPVPSCTVMFLSPGH